MRSMISAAAFAFGALSVATTVAGSNSVSSEAPCHQRRPGQGRLPGFRIVGNVYYVGTYDLASYLHHHRSGSYIWSTPVSEARSLMIRSSIESLGFRFSDIRLLLATHGHWDHVGGMAAIKRMTDARMLMHEADVPVLEDGGNSDFRFYPKGREQCTSR